MIFGLNQAFIKEFENGNLDYELQQDNDHEDQSSSDQWVLK